MSQGLPVRGTNVDALQLRVTDFNGNSRGRRTTTTTRTNSSYGFGFMNRPGPSSLTNLTRKLASSSSTHFRFRSSGARIGCSRTKKQVKRSIGLFGFLEGTVQSSSRGTGLIYVPRPFRLTYKRINKRSSPGGLGVTAIVTS